MAAVLNDTDVKRRKSSFAGKIEVQGPNGNTRVVALEEMSEADAALAAKFGYKPVFKRVHTSSTALPSPERLGLTHTAGVWISGCVLLRRQHQRALLHGCDYVLLPDRLGRECQCGLVLVHFWSWVHVFGCKHCDDLSKSILLMPTVVRCGIGLGIPYQRRPVLHCLASRAEGKCCLDQLVSMRSTSVG